MLYFKEYMVSVSAVLIFSVFVTEIMTDVSWNKYLNFICGILFIITILSPIKNFSDVGFLKNIIYDKESSKHIDYTENEIRAEFNTRLKKIIKEDIKNTFSKEIELDIVLNNDSTIKIILYSNVTDDIYEYIKDNYKPDIIQLDNNQKE